MLANDMTSEIWIIFLIEHKYFSFIFLGLRNDMIWYHTNIGNFNTNYIIYRKFGIFWKKFFKQKKLVNENIESSRIFYLSKLKFQN
jgi:hypothetical protein